MIVRAFVISMFLLAFGGCQQLKVWEGRAYDLTAKGVSRYCGQVVAARDEGSIGGLVTEERIQLRREIRQRGTFGPDPVRYADLDEQTSGAVGPVVLIYCDGDAMPEDTWRQLIKPPPYSP